MGWGVTNILLDKNVEIVCTILDSLDITYEMHAHKAVFTVDESRHYTGHIDGIRCKNLLLRNKKGNRNYLLITLADTKVELQAIAAKIEESRLSLASPDRLKKLLDLTPGSVSPFGLLNDTENSVVVLLDKQMLAEKKLNFHPNANTNTVTLTVADFMKYLNHIGNSYRVVTL